MLCTFSMARKGGPSQLETAKGKENAFRGKKRAPRGGGGGEGGTGSSN